MKPAQHPENFMYFDLECQRKGCQALVIAAQAERVEELERELAEQTRGWNECFEIGMKLQARAERAERELAEALARGDQIRDSMHETNETLLTENVKQRERAEQAERALAKEHIRTGNCWLNDDMPCDRLREATGRSEQSEALVEQLQGALRELVRLKDLPYPHDPNNDLTAWKAARSALSGHAHAPQNDESSAEYKRGFADAVVQCALACIDMPQQGGSTYTYWPCVNAIRALGHAHE